MDAITAAARPALGARAGGPGATPPNATVVAREDVSATILRLRLRPDGGVPAFEPGQYLALGVEAGARLLQRPYSTASARGETEQLEFLVRLVPGGALTPRLWRLSPGDRLAMGRPKGLFALLRDDPRRPLFVATGTGIAPLVSMLDSRLREAPDGPAARRPIVVHGAAHVADLAYRDRLAGLAAAGRITYVPAVSRPDDPANRGWRGVTGRLDAVLPLVLEACGAAPGATVAYVCGNPAMVDAVRATLAGLRLPADAVRSEAYWVPRAA